jgi:hypothetical protein
LRDVEELGWISETFLKTLTGKHKPFEDLKHLDVLGLMN